MKDICVTCFLVGLWVILPIRAHAQNAASPGISDLGGMAGCWEKSDPAKGLLISEQWMRPAGTSIIGMARTVRNGRTTGYEFMRIEQRSDGIFFVARPSANKEDTDFKLKSSTQNELVFENLAHDFPQRVIYRFGGDKMTGRIEGMNKGKPMAIDFPYVRVSCT